MGLTTSPAVMTRCMNALFITHIRSFYYAYHKEHMPERNYVFSFIDDIILATESQELHYKIIEVTFYICTQYGLTLKPGKCATGYEYLGNIVSGKATWPTPHRVKALVNMSLPTTVTELRSFLGAMGFVLNIYATQFTGVTRLSASPVVWQDAKLSEHLCSGQKQLSWPLKIKHKLIHFAYNYIIDPEAPLFIYADSSLTAIGAALTQDIKGVLLPVGFMSKSLNPTQTRYPIFDKELYSCFMAVKYFSAEISGRQVTMYNDHYALVQQYNRPEQLQSNIASEQRLMRMMGELSIAGWS